MLNKIWLLVMIVALLVLPGLAQDDATDEDAASEELLTVITTGVAQETYEHEVTSECDRGNFRTGLMGELTDDNGNVWFVPGPVAGGDVNVDVYNDCTSSGDNADFESELETQVIDEDGEEITAYLFADNYYEFYVNGEFAGRDAVNFTTFNSHAARFQAEYPITYAALLVDWEEYNGIGMEERDGYHIGDGGFIATFSDGNLTSEDWVCRTFYVSPLDDASCLAIDENGNVDSSACPSSDQEVGCRSDDPENTCQAFISELPENWMSSEYDDSGWLPASTYTADDVTNANGFRDYEDTLFADADFIWTSNLNLDNLVVCRATVEGPTE